MGAAIQEKRRVEQHIIRTPYSPQKREGRSLTIDDFVVDDRHLQADLVVQSLPDHCLQKLLGLSTSAKEATLE
jgi:hypothetical protein